jgi:hypothetical protein
MDGQRPHRETRARYPVIFAAKNGMRRFYPFGGYKVYHQVRSEPRLSHTKLLLTASVALSVLTACTPQREEAAAASPVPTAAQRCEALATTPESWPDPSMRILSAVAQPEGSTADMGFGPMRSPPLPAHCEINGILRERTGADGEHYAIRFHLRLPETWNGSFLFEGGGGTDGNLGGAIGMISFGAPPAIGMGYAVVSDDSGHSNQLNNKPAEGGMVSFGRDPQARADYGHAALKSTYDAAQAIIARFYNRGPDHRYFVGCSKGGQEGLAFAERYPDAFDGILAGSPGMSLPRAALGHPWAAQVFGAVVGGSRTKSIPVARLAESLSDADLELARQAVLDACDADDGLKDGIVGAVGQCVSKKVLPQFRKRQCKGAKSASCLSNAQIAALEKFFGGPRNSKGEALYATFPWDAGIANQDWRGWTIGVLPGAAGTLLPAASRGGGMPPVGVTMGAGSLSEVFSTPPKVIPQDPQGAFEYLLRFDFDKDAPAIYATTAEFPRSGWDDANARSPDLDAFRKHGGKLIVYQGASDGVFSLNDTIAWWNEVNARMSGQAADTVRLFPVPGMGHCMGGPATDQFDGFGVLVKWVEQGQAPDRIEAKASPRSPWPGRSRPLCLYPETPRYKGVGDIERSENFVCARPQSTE